MEAATTDKDHACLVISSLIVLPAWCMQLAQLAPLPVRRGHSVICQVGGLILLHSLVLMVLSGCSGMGCA